MTDAQEKRLGWGLVIVGIVLFAGPLAGSSIVDAGIAAAGAAWHALAD